MLAISPILLPTFIGVAIVECLEDKPDWQWFRNVWKNVFSWLIFK
jgi:hypothetical protein